LGCFYFFFVTYLKLNYRISEIDIEAIEIEIKEEWVKEQLNQFSDEFDALFSGLKSLFQTNVILSYFYVSTGGCIFIFGVIYVTLVMMFGEDR